MSTVEKYCKGGLVMPDWVSVEDTIPTEDGGYYAVVEYLKDTETNKKGTTDFEGIVELLDGKWSIDDSMCKVVYWAYPMVIMVPSEADGYPKATIDPETSHTIQETAGIFPQPCWVSVEDFLPPEDGDYFTLSEAQSDFNAIKKGTISVNDSNEWKDGEWYTDDENWKVLYWAYPVRTVVPAKYADRPRIGVL